MTATASLLGTPTAWADVKGFNYQPSYGTNGYELWTHFDAALVEREVALAVEHFPGINALRWWLSWDAFDRDADAFERNFETALQIAARHRLAVMPVLFNRWHAAVTDYGGIYIDHFLPGASFVQYRGDVHPREYTWKPEHSRTIFDHYLERIVGGHAGDERIFTWDVCNEPYCYHLCPLDQMPPVVVEAETAWLAHTSETCRRLDPDTPRGVSIHSSYGGHGMEMVEPICDVLLFHNYFSNAYFPEGEGILDEYAQISADSGKPLLCTETCWGSFDDAERVEIVKATLSTLRRRRIGWLAYTLHHSLIVDAHRPEHGPTHSFIGTLHFVEPNGTLRPGHEVFNDY